MEWESHRHYTSMGEVGLVAFGLVAFRAGLEKTERTVRYFSQEEEEEEEEEEAQPGLSHYPIIYWIVDEE